MGHVKPQTKKIEPLSLFNKNSQIYLNPFSATYSVICLIFCDPSAFLNFTWRVYEDSCRSDHFPIVIESSHLQEEDLLQWRLSLAKWKHFKSLCFKHLI